MKASIHLLALAYLASIAAASVPSEIDWPEFIGRHDLVWEETPLQWNEGGFTGNGQLGMMVYATLDDNRLDFHLGRADVTAPPWSARQPPFSPPPVRPPAPSTAFTPKANS
jgi:hypothetical protein